MTNTTPIENILQESIPDWAQDYIRFVADIRAVSPSLDLVAFHKSCFGKQSRTLNGEFRYWIWVTPKWTIFVSNLKGLTFEVPSTASRDEALSAWVDYKDRVLHTATKPVQPPPPKYPSSTFGYRVKLRPVYNDPQ